MTRKTAIAFMLAGAVIIAAAPSSAAERDGAGNPWYGGASEGYSRGSRHRNGAPQVPDCAYPQHYDSGGVAIFQRYGCRLP
jgi:hypothetical protein